MLYAKLSAPITCQIELTSGCNCDCIYCYNHWRHGPHVSIANMTSEILDSTVEQLIECNLFQVVFTGGECMLMKKQLFRSLDRLISSGTYCTVNSNLTLLEPADARELYRIGLRGILTSLSTCVPEKHDSIFNRKGSFEKAVRGIHAAMDAGIHVASSMVIMNENVNDVLATGLFLKKIGVRQFFATKASPPLNAEGFEKFMISIGEMVKVMDDLNALKNVHGMDVGILECYPLCSYGLPEKYPFVSSRRCSAGITTVTIGSDGNIRPCSHSDKLYGNIASDGLRKSWAAMEECRDGSLLPQVCKECSLLPDCSGGCRVDALYCSGRYQSLDPYARPSAVRDIVPMKNIIPEVGSDMRMRVNDKLRIRRESIGVLCADPVSVAVPAVLTEDTYDLVCDFKAKTFTVQDIAKYTELSEAEVRQLCGLLVRDRIFVRE